MFAGRMQFLISNKHKQNQLGYQNRKLRSFCFHPYITDYCQYLRILINICMSQFMFQGKVTLLSLEALHQLHIFIFVLALVHVIFCATTMFLGGLRVSLAVLSPMFKPSFTQWWINSNQIQPVTVCVSSYADSAMETMGRFNKGSER